MKIVIGDRDALYVGGGTRYRYVKIREIEYLEKDGGLFGFSDNLEGSDLEMFNRLRNAHVRFHKLKGSFAVEDT